MRTTTLAIAAAAESLSAQLSVLKEQPAWLTRAESRLHRRLAEVLREPTRAVVSRLRDTGRIPTSAAELRRLTAPLEAAAGDVGDRLVEASTEPAKRARREVVETAADQGLDVAVKAATVVAAEPPENIRRLLEEASFEASASTTARISGDVMTGLRAAQEAGLGVEETAALLEESFDGMLDWQLRRVARTELNAYGSLGAHETMRELGVGYHQWWSAQDDRVRDSHVSLHGEITRIGQPFSNALLYPHDRTGPTEEWINCRCRALPWIPPQGARIPAGGPFHESDVTVR